MNNNHKNRGEKMIKLIAVDMDGTLLNNEKHIAEAQREALKKAASAGIKVVLCTGRPYSEFYLFIKNWIYQVMRDMPY